MKTCFICQGENWKSLGVNQGRQILQCIKCGLGSTKGEFVGLYKQYHRDSAYQQFEDRFINIFNKRYNFVAKYKKGGSVLDVGSSTGTFLKIFQEHGWRTKGVESSEKACQLARSAGLDVINQEFEQIDFDQDFDVVCASHILEHVADPGIFLAKVKQILKIDGLLLLDLPNFSSLSARLLGSRWYYILPNEHRWHFTKKSLSILLDQTGFEILEARTASGIFDYDSPWMEIWQAARTFKKRLLGDVITIMPSWIVTMLNLGTSLTIIARKKAKR
ncbi:class I SAM-dependent methyltransferase [Candidatus Daviesbacteria bacterium]|nr:class I SAM-dependent methyltransferase [Candidatus Daviesbacteria bacterium]